MYVCDVCRVVVPPNTPCALIAVETREVSYPLRPAIYWHPPEPGKKGEWVPDPGGVGVAIVRELRACPACAAK